MDVQLKAEMEAALSEYERLTAEHPLPEIGLWDRLKSLGQATAERWSYRESMLSFRAAARDLKSAADLLNRMIRGTHNSDEIIVYVKALQALNREYHRLANAQLLASEAAYTPHAEIKAAVQVLRRAKQRIEQVASAMSNVAALLGAFERFIKSLEA